MGWAGYQVYGKSIPEGIFTLVPCQQANGFLLLRKIVQGALAHTNPMGLRWSLTWSCWVAAVGLWLSASRQAQSKVMSCCFFWFWFFNKIKVQIGPQTREDLHWLEINHHQKHANFFKSHYVRHRELSPVLCDDLEARDGRELGAGVCAHTAESLCCTAETHTPLWSNCALVDVQSFSRVWLCATPWTVAHQAPLSMGLSRQEDWRGLPFPSLGDRPDPGVKPASPA